jgi:hypothetical protein
VRIARELQPRVILVLGGLVFLLYAYPGQLSIDSVDQLIEARDGFYTDAHPPAMAAIWNVLDHVIAGPFLMLLLQSITFLAGLYLVLSRALAPRNAAIAAVLVLLFPPVTCTMAFIWKDSLMAGMLALGAGLVTSPCRRARIASLGCFALATAVKYNAFAATLPLIVLLFEWTPGKRWLVRHALALATWLGVTLSAIGINAVLVDQPMHFWHSSLAIYDIAGVINYEDTMTDVELRAELEGTGLRVERNIQATARRIYGTRNLMRLVAGKQRMWNVPTSGRVPAPEAQRDAIEAAWWRMVGGHPASYLKHRAAMFSSVLGLSYGSFGAVPYRTTSYAPATRLGLDQTPMSYQDAWSSFYRWLSDTPLFRQWLYILIAVLLLPLCRRERVIGAVLASGLVIEASLFVLAPSADYRYSHWTIVCTCVAFVMLSSQLLPLLRTSRMPSRNSEMENARAE